MEDEEIELEEKNLADEVKEKSLEDFEEWPTVRRSQRGKVSKNITSSPGTSSSKPDLSQTIDDFVEDVEEEERLDKQGNTDL